MALDLGDVWSVTFYTKDVNGNLAAPLALPTATVMKPDATTTAGTVTLVTVGTYRMDVTTATVPGRWTVLASWGAAAAQAGVYTDVAEITDPAFLPLVSLDDAKLMLGLGGTTAYDERIRAAVSEATEMAESYCNRAFRRQTATELHDGGVRAVNLRLKPVISITTAVENGVTLTGTDYVLDPIAGMLFRGSSIARIPWYPGIQTVSVTYVAGYAAPPVDVVRGVKELTRWLWQPDQVGNRPGFASEQPAGSGAAQLPPRPMAAFDAYRIGGIA